ncbi:chaplin [Streptomyces peucetius]|uniref:chaplin n=1 Tax=Streptomyces peucetius TaxID=1950 RepID=UPI00299F6E18|nr:chaplin family protein [Streptomyces peucetius]
MRQVTRKGLITVAAAGGVLALGGGGYAQADAGANGTASNSPGVLSGNSVQVPVHIPVNVCGNTVDVVGLLNPTFGNECANVSGSGAGGGGSSAEGTTSNSPGVLSGNNVQAPVDVPVNVCGNSVNVGGLLNPVSGNGCANGSGATTPGTPDPGTPDPGTPDPGTPDPGTPDPGTPDPGTPDPGTPDPGTPETPETPGTPETPETPGTPETPETPGTPETPATPASPATPETPGTPTGPNTPESRTVTPPGGAQLAETGMDALDVVAPAGVGLLLAGAVLYRRTRAAL